MAHQRHRPNASNPRIVGVRAGLSRDTIHRWIRAGDLDPGLDDTPVRYGPTRAPADQARCVKPIIEARLAAYPELSAVRLFNEIAPPAKPGATRS